MTDESPWFPHVAALNDELHELRQQARIDGPYVLVGHFDTFAAGAVDMRAVSRSIGNKPLIVLTRGKEDVFWKTERRVNAREVIVNRRAMRRLLAIVACALVACGDSSSNAGDGRDGSIDDPSADAGTSSDASTSADASERDSAVVSSDSGDAGQRQAIPPAGWAMCGTGAITKEDALAACNEIGASPKDCDTVTVSGGKWTVWCDPGKAIYVWATIDGLSQTTATSCAGSVPFVDHVNSAFDISGGGVGGGGSVLQPTTRPPRSSSAEYELQRPTTATSGQGTLVIGARLAVDAGCALTNDPTANLVTGFHIQWQ